MSDPLTDYVRGIHPKLINHVFLQLGLWANDGDYQIFEYDVQAVMNGYLRTVLRNTAYEAIRERDGKFDCLVRSKRKKTSALLYELKTFIKDSEVVDEDALLKDIGKLAKRRLEANPPRTFFVLAARRGKLFSQKEPKASLPAFLAEHLSDNKKRQRMDVDTGERALRVTVRPSTKRLYGAICVLSWEVLSARRLPKKR